MKVIAQIGIGLALLAGAFLWGRSSVPPRTVKEFVVDSTRVETLEKELEYWQSVEPDTVFKTLEVPVPVEKDGTNVYNVPYSDENISSNIGLTVDGVVEDVTFEYFMKREFVRERTKYVHTDRYVERTITVESPTPNFKHSFEVGMKMDRNLEQSIYGQYRPEFSVLGIDLVGTAHLSEDWYVAVGIKKEF